jgi:hypothetical protein
MRTCQQTDRQTSALSVNFIKSLSDQGQLNFIALVYWLDNRDFESQKGLGIFFFTTASRLALGPTQPPIQ